MHFLLKILGKFLVNIVAIILLGKFFSDFIIANGPLSYAIAAIVLTLVNVFIRPVLKLITFPFILITFGLFNIVLHIVILYITDALTPALSIGSTPTLVWASLILGIINSII